MKFDNLTEMFKKTWKYLLVALIATIALRYQFGPEFFDLFGLIVFGGLILVSLWGLYSNKKLPSWVLFAILILGIGGLLVDGWTSFNLLKSWILRGLI